MADLRAVLAASLGTDETFAEGGDVVLAARHEQALRDAAAALDSCAAEAERAGDILDVAELVAMELREALDALGAIAGEITTEDLLGRVFASFCIGK